MSGAEDVTNTGCCATRRTPTTSAAGDPPALSHRDDALRQLRTDPALLSARGSRLRWSCSGAERLFGRVSGVTAQWWLLERRCGPVSRDAAGGSGQALCQCTDVGLAAMRRAGQLIVDRLLHAAEIARFYSHVVCGPTPSDWNIWTGAIGADGYGRN